MPSNAPYGTWKSPINADLLTQKSISISDILVDPVSSEIYHVEGRPYEDGRSVPVQSASGSDVIPSGWNARTRVHEYGGAATAVRGGVLFFSDVKSSRLFKVSKPGETPVPVTPDNENHRFANFTIHPTKPHLLVSILEDHTKPAPADVVNKLVYVNTATLTVSTLVSGADFYSSPTFSPDGKRIAYIQWNHPNMPWEVSELYVANIDTTNDSIAISGTPILVAGKGEQSVSKPAWISDDSLVFLNDIAGFYNPWVYDVKAAAARAILPKPVSEDYTEPDWILGESRFAVLDPSTILATPIRESATVFTLIDVPSGNTQTIDSPYVNVAQIKGVNANQAVFIGTQNTAPAALVLVTLERGVAQTRASFETLKETSSLASAFSDALISPVQSITLPNPTTAEPLHVLYSAPRNPDYSPDGKGDGEKPPAIINVHGGPTSRTAPGLDWTTQYYTSRGWAFVDVNYGGSSGYGRAYRERLRGNWGIVDVEDSVTAVKQLAARGLIDPARVAIRGRSAGGYTTLEALVDKPDVFTAGTSSFGISDLVVLAGDTHKFESRYGEKLLGGTIEENPKVYHDRSPLHRAENITAPLLILQGSIDAVVPPNQAELIVKKIKERGGRVKYVLFEGEGHGWRKSENIKTALETELAWYEEVFNVGPNAQL